ncbi:MAG: hypothetical protein PHF84_01235 [bacterium]|nr:hypothetical protein [bacterium]
MPDQELLECLKQNGLDHSSLEEAVRSEPEKVLEKLNQAVYDLNRHFTPEVMDLLIKNFPGHASLFGILHILASRQPERSRIMINHFQENFPKAPVHATNELYYISTNDPHLLDPGLLRLSARYLDSNPYTIYQIFQFAVLNRPELIDESLVDRLISGIHRAPNQAFYFIRELIKKRPEFMPSCCLALFECINYEEHYYVKREMLQDIKAVAEFSHVKTSIEKALRRPMKAGSKRSRVLMAIMFRQSRRSKQAVLLNSLDLMGQWPVLWEFLLFLIDISDDKNVSSAAAAQFLEKVYRLSFLVDGYVFNNLLVEKIAETENNRTNKELPAELFFLSRDRELGQLYNRVAGIADRTGQSLRLAPLLKWQERVKEAEEELLHIHKNKSTTDPELLRKLEIREHSLRNRLERWEQEKLHPDAVPGPDAVKEQHELLKKLVSGLRAEAVNLVFSLIQKASQDVYTAAARDLFGREIDLSKADPDILPAFLYFRQLSSGFPNNRKYLLKLIEDSLENRPHDWMWTEPKVREWAGQVKKTQKDIDLKRWRAEFRKEYLYDPADAFREKQERIQKDIQEARKLFKELKVKGMENADYNALREKYLELSEKPDKKPDQAIFGELGTDLERIRITQETPDSDYAGKIILEIETNPFQYLFMGEYGFASCLSIRGAYVWSAISNAIDIDKAVIWAREPEGNIIGRRLIALTPHGIISYRTYANRHGLAIDRFFTRFIREYAEHCHTVIARQIKWKPLLSDRWYDDGSL